MILYWIWFVVLSALGFYITWAYAWKNGEIFGQICLILSVVIPWKIHGAPIYNYLYSTIPSGQVAIHELSVLTIMAIIGLLWLVLLPALIMDASMKRGGKS